jgi:hypothetical protein
MAGGCECGNEPSGFIKCEEFFGQNFPASQAITIYTWAVLRSNSRWTLREFSLIVKEAVTRKPCIRKPLFVRYFLPYSGVDSFSVVLVLHFLFTLYIIYCLACKNSAYVSVWYTYHDLTVSFVCSLCVLLHVLTSTDGTAITDVVSKAKKN